MDKNKKEHDFEKSAPFDSSNPGNRHPGNDKPEDVEKKGISKKPKVISNPTKPDNS